MSTFDHFRMTLEKFGKFQLVLMLATLALLATLCTVHAAVVKNRGRDRSGSGAAPVKPGASTPAVNNNSRIVKNQGMHGEGGSASHHINQSLQIAESVPALENFSLITADESEIRENNGHSRGPSGSDISLPGWISFQGDSMCSEGTSLTAPVFPRGHSTLPRIITIPAGGGQIVIPVHGFPIIIIGGKIIPVDGTSELPCGGGNEHVVPPVSPAPLPPSLYFFFSGIVAIFIMNRRRKIKACPYEAREP